VICSVLIVTTITSLRASKKLAATEAAQAQSEGAPKDSIQA
jgi:tellurite resistance protein TerC